MGTNVIDCVLGDEQQQNNSLHLYIDEANDSFAINCKFHKTGWVTNEVKKKQ